MKGADDVTADGAPPEVVPGSIHVPRAVAWLVVALALVPACVVAWGTWAFPAFVLFDLVVAMLAVIDLEQFRVPNRILGPGLLAGFVLLGAAALLGSDWGRFGVSIGCAFVIFVIFEVMHYIQPRQLGMGDVKLAPYVALHVAWIGLAPVMWAFVAAAVALGLLSLASQQFKFYNITFKSTLPYAPFLAFGALLVQLFHPGGA
jgi:leader peptidase (prepilin peptidase) / N-methyltransferase